MVMMMTMMMTLKMPMVSSKADHCLFADRVEADNEDADFNFGRSICGKQNSISQRPNAKRHVLFT